MKKELQEQIFKKYPLLFSDRTKPMQETCMCWGLTVGDGWYNLIDELCAKLEPLVQDYIKKNPNTPCSRCGCPKEHHYGHRSWSPGKCLSVRRVGYWQPYRRGPGWWPLPFRGHGGERVRTQINRLVQKLYQAPFAAYNFVTQTAAKVVKIFIHRHEACHCEKYEAIYPRASQVKEKFAGLRFYMTYGTEEIYKIIHEAEAKSFKICDRCGGEGETLNTGGWLHAACKECLTKEGREFKESDFNDEDEDDL